MTTESTLPQEQKEQLRPKAFAQIVFYKANMITILRFVLLLFAIELYQLQCIYTTASFTMLSVILDYADGMAARMYNQCSFFGEMIDWLTDVATTIFISQWLISLQPQFHLVYGCLIMIQLLYMATDLVGKSKQFQKKQLSQSIVCVIFKVTKKFKDGKQTYSTIGYWNQIVFYLCLIARVLYLKTKSQFWWSIFILNLPIALTYPWSDLAEIVKLMKSWREVGNGQQIVVDFQK